MRFFLHSCGKIDAIVPDVIELGFDILHPLQPECFDFAEVYRQYGKQIALVCNDVFATNASVRHAGRCAPRGAEAGRRRSAAIDAAF